MNLLDDSLEVNWIVSEFSAHEVLYMGNEFLTHIVEDRVNDYVDDPFDLLALIEEQLGHPLAFKES